MSKASLELGGGNWGTKDGNLLAYAQGNESINLVPREFTFTRGSDIAATRINSSGLIEKYRENLFTQSNNFSDSDWNTTSGSSFVGGQSGYDGSSDAWLFTDSGAVLGYGAYQDKVVNGVHTYSIYVKEGSTSTFVIDSFQSPRPSVTIDLTNGNVTASNEIDAKSELISNGWYRLSLTFNASSTLYMRLGCNGAGSVYIQDAQLEQGLVATSYLESGATTATSGVADNEPRIDYAGGTASLLLEPQRSNIATNSEYMLGFNKGSASSLEANAAISPDGKSNATYFYCNTTTTNAYLLPSFNGTSGVQYTVSFYAKAKELNRIYIKNVNDSDSQSWFDLSDGTYNLLSGIDSMSIESAGDGWYRCTAVSTSTTTGIKWVPILKGDANEGVYVYGLQIEQGSYPTSYIPTYGTSVTREADGELYKDLAANNFIGDTFSIFFEIDNVNYGTANSNFNYLNSSIGGSAMYVYGSTLGIHTTTGDDYSTFLQGFTNPKGGKFLAVYNGSNVKIYKDGSLYRTISNPSARWDNVTIYRLRMYSATATSSYKSLMIFPSALSDREAVDLTSPYSTYQELVTAEGLTWESPTCTTNSITELQSI